ncbi:MAG: adenosylcobinamide-GDP ribazoletransferase [Lachnospiraceae bacterium]|nr:adenosylcobinamide-GDP ribazoletransferase [Lachnospiraceae bacterium]
MDFFRSLAIAFSMYSAIPMPQFQWDQKNYEHSFAFFPLVGAGLSAVLYFAYRGLGWLGTDSMAESLILTAIIVIYTGGFHIDGYMDTMDALCSHRSRDEKIRIMKDPHIGAFGVIQLVVLALLMTAGIYELLVRGRFYSLLFAFVVSRALSGVGVCTFKRRDNNTSLIRFETKGSRQFTLTLMFIYVFAVLAISFMSRNSSVIIATLVCVVWLFISKLICEKEFSGISGDTSGYFLCICEAVFVWSVALDTAIRAHI